MASSTGDEAALDGSQRALVVTRGGSFRVSGSMHDTLHRLAAEEWPLFTLADNDESIVIRSSEVIAVQNVSASKGRLGF